MTPKTLADILEILLAKKRTWDVDMSLKIVIGGTEIGAIVVTGKIEYIPPEMERTTAK